MAWSCRAEEMPERLELHESHRAWTESHQTDPPTCRHPAGLWRVRDDHDQREAPWSMEVGNSLLCQLLHQSCSFCMNVPFTSINNQSTFARLVKFYFVNVQATLIAQAAIKLNRTWIYYKSKNACMHAPKTSPSSITTQVKSNNR